MVTTSVFDKNLAAYNAKKRIIINQGGTSSSKTSKTTRTSRTTGHCHGREARPDLPCIWNLIYLATLAVGDDPGKFARILVPPRDWCLDRTNALANRFAGLDNLCKRIDLKNPNPQPRKGT